MSEQHAKESAASDSMSATVMRLFVVDRWYITAFWKKGSKL